MDKSPLKKLSAELRNTIAEMALSHDQSLVIGGKANPSHVAAFAQTCKELRHDYTRLFLSLNNFVCQVTYRNLMQKVERFLESYAIHQNTKSVELLLTSDSDEKILMVIREMQSSCPRLAYWVQSLKERGLSLPPVPVSGLRLKVPFYYTQGYREYIIDRDDPLGSVREAMKSVDEELFLWWTPNNSIATTQYHYYYDLEEVSEVLELVIARLSRMKAEVDEHEKDMGNLGRNST